MNALNPAQDIENGRYNEIFSTLYPGEDLSFHRERWLSLIEIHRNNTGQLSPRFFSAPGRTELAGNHTDHNRGRVLAASIQLDTIAAITETNDDRVNILSEGYPPVHVDLNCLDKAKTESGKTDSLIRGIAASIVKRGGKVGGFTASTTSRVLKGSGLSSSAALEILVGSIYSEVYNKGRFSPVELAIIGQEAENNYFDKPSGLMDQIACAVGGVVSIDFVDALHPLVEPLNACFTETGYTLAIVDSKADHANLTPDYAAVPMEMQAVAAELNAEVLRDTVEEEFYKAIPRLRENTGDRAILRALHFYTENKRVDAMADSLKQRDIDSYLAGVQLSGDSSFRFLQNIYSSRNPENQALTLALALTDLFLDGQGASRVHGGGFAGTIQAFIPTPRFNDYVQYMENFFGTGCVLNLEVRTSPAGEIKADL